MLEFANPEDEQYFEVAQVGHIDVETGTVTFGPNLPSRARFLHEMLACYQYMYHKSPKQLVTDCLSRCDEMLALNPELRTHELDYMREDVRNYNA